MNKQPRQECDGTDTRIAFGSLPEELTTTVAAKLLGVSQPTLMKMIDRGDIPAHKVMSEHRLKTSDVRAFQKARLERQRVAFDELRTLDDELENYSVDG